jgi:hypothetical protein
MVQVGCIGDGRRGRIDAQLSTGFAWSSDMLRTEDDGLTPHAFFVHQDPNVVLDRHYHDAAEFQVVVGGSGRLGTHAVRPLSVHYASYQAVYGPLAAGEFGLDYVTCRAVYQRGLFRFPDERRRMTPGRRDQYIGEVLPGDPRSLTGISIDPVIDPLGDGLAVWMMRIPPGARSKAPIHPGGAGRFLLLTAGGATVESAILDELSVGWIGNGEATVAAGPEGAELVVLQLPAAAGEIGQR